MAQLGADLTEGNVQQKLIRFSIPFFFSNLLQALYGIFDTLIVARFSGQASITGVTQGSQIMNVITFLVIGLSEGGAIMVSQYLGAKQHKDKEETISTVFLAMLIIAAVITACMLFFSRSILTAIKMPEEAFGEAIKYLNICVSGTVFIFVYNGVSAVMRGLGDSKRPLLFVGVACVVNVTLDLVFIVKMNMGAAGAAYATVIAQAMSVFIAITYLKIKKFGFDYKLKSLKFYPHKFGVLIKLGLPMTIHKTTASLSFVVLTSFINRFGLPQAAVAGIVSKLDSLVLLPFSAMQSSVAAMIGQNAGARRYDRVRQTLIVGLKITLICGVVFFTACQLFPDKAIGIFSTDPELIALGVPFFRYYSIEFLFMSFTFVLLALPVGTGYTFMSLVYTFAVSLAVRIPCAYLFAFVLGMGFNGVALGMAIAPVGALVAGGAFYASKIWMKPVKGLNITEPTAAE